MFEVAPDLSGRWPTEAACFDEVMQLEGELFREFANRRTLRAELGQQPCFVKLHLGVGWPEIAKNLLTFRAPVLGASNEWRALNLLTRLGVRVPRPLAYAVRGVNPARQHSFVVMEALEGLMSLEELTETWRGHPPRPRVRAILAESLADLTRTLHENGVNHRDYYLCHVLVDPAWASTRVPPTEAPTLHLIDLHRAQIRDRVPERWRVKDVGGLLFSAFEARPSRTDLARFVRGYTGKSLRASLAEDRTFWRRVLRRARRLYLQDHPEVPAWVAALERELA